MTNIREQVEQRLQDQQKNKSFKDVGRVAQTRKEKSGYKLISALVLNQLEEDAVMAYNMVKKENVWPEINVLEERERGVTAGAAYLKVKLREAVPTRPKDEKAKRATYVLFLGLLQKDLIECYDVAQVKALVDRYRNLPMDQIIGYFINSEFLTATPERKLQIEEALKQNKNIRIAFLYGANSLLIKLINEVFSSRFENVLFNRSEAGAVIWMEAKDKEPISKEQSEILIAELQDRRKKFVEANEALKEKYKTKTDAELRYSMDHDWQLHGESKKLYKLHPEKFREFVISYYDRRINKEGTLWGEKEKKMQPRDNDWSWFESPKTKEISSKPKSEAINTKDPLDYIKRTGGYKIEAVTPKEIIEKFGFSAVNYGVYVDDKWSKEHTKHFLGAISDLGDILNINIKQLNELGKLSIAFGAKGRRGAMATYFPQTKDINLTRGNGDGSLAHEWGHYFDNVIVELDKKLATNQFATEGYSPDYEIKALFKELMDFFYKGNPLFTPKVPMNFYAQKQDTAPSFSSWYNNQWNNATIEIKETIEETLEQLESIAIVDRDRYRTQLRLFGYVIDKFGLEQYSVPMKLKTSYMFHKSAYSMFQYCFKADKGIDIAVVTRTKYWTSAVELFARSWETVVLKKLLDAGRESNYLVAGIPLEDIVSDSYYRPYPTGKELEYIETIIDKIITAVKHKYNIGNFIAPSSVIEDEYFYLSKTGIVETGVVIDEKAEKIVEEVIDGNEIKDQRQKIKDEKPIEMEKNITIFHIGDTIEDSKSQAVVKKIHKPKPNTPFYGKEDQLLDIERSNGNKAIGMPSSQFKHVDRNEDAATQKDSGLIKSSPMNDLINVALQDVISIHEYGNLELAEAKVLYSLTEKQLRESDFTDSNPFSLRESIYKSLYDMGYVTFDDNNEYILSEVGNKFISAINARIETLKGIESGTDLFPEEANLTQHKPEDKIYVDLKSCLISEGDDEALFIFEGKEFTSKQDGVSSRWRIVNFFKYGITVEYVAKNKLSDKKDSKKLTFDELRQLEKDGDIFIDGIDGLNKLNHCLKLLTKCIDNIDLKEEVEKDKKELSETKKEKDETKKELDGIKSAAKAKEEKEKENKEIVEQLMEIDSQVWSDLKIESGSQLYADLELQEKYKAELDKKIKEGKFSFPLDMEVHDLIEDDNYHALNQYLYLSNAFGEKEKEKWIEFLEKIKPGSKTNPLNIKEGNFLNLHIFSPGPSEKLTKEVLASRLKILKKMEEKNSSPTLKTRIKILSKMIKSESGTKNQESGQEEKKEGDQEFCAGGQMDYNEGGKFEKGRYVIVSEKDGYTIILSRPVTKEFADSNFELFTRNLPKGETGRIATLEELKGNKKIIGEEYLEMAKGGEVGKFQKGDEGMWEGDEVMILKVYPDKYSIANLDSDGDISLLEANIREVPASEFDKSFAKFPNKKQDPYMEAQAKLNEMAGVKKGSAQNTLRS